MKENDQNNDATLLWRRIWNLFTFTSSRCINRIKKKCAKIDIEAPQASNLPQNSVKLNLAGLHLNLILNKEDFKLFYKSKSIDSYIALLNHFFFLTFFFLLFSFIFFLEQFWFYDLPRKTQIVWGSENTHSNIFDYFHFTVWKRFLADFHSTIELFKKGKIELYSFIRVASKKKNF